MSIEGTGLTSPCRLIREENEKAMREMAEHEARSTISLATAAIGTRGHDYFLGEVELIGRVTYGPGRVVALLRTAKPVTLRNDVAPTTEHRRSARDYIAPSKN